MIVGEYKRNASITRQLRPTVPAAFASWFSVRQARGVHTSVHVSGGHGRLIASVGFNV